MAKSNPPSEHRPAEPPDTDNYLIDVSADSSNHELLALTHCPICGTEIIDDLETSDRIEIEKVADHIGTHSPADLNVDGPYHFTPMADILISLHGMDD